MPSITFNVDKLDRTYTKKFLISNYDYIVVFLEFLFTLLVLPFSLTNNFVPISFSYIGLIGASIRWILLESSSKVLSSYSSTINIIL